MGFVYNFTSDVNTKEWMIGWQCIPINTDVCELTGNNATDGIKGTQIVKYII